MELIDIAAHLIVFSLPAVGLALLMPVAARWLVRRGPGGPRYPAQAAIIFMVGMAVLAGGLLGLGRDGAMATYSTLALVAGATQWLLVRGWRK